MRLHVAPEAHLLGRLAALALIQIAQPLVEHGRYRVSQQLTKLSHPGEQRVRVVRLEDPTVVSGYLP